MAPSLMEVLKDEISQPKSNININETVNSVFNAFFLSALLPNVALEYL